MADLPKTYEPTEIEPRWYAEWMTRGYFHADAAAPKAPFAIVIPPPNVTGSLHMGHALGDTIEDIFTRWRRMAAYNAMWLPGSDHAGIATQMVVERELKAKEKKSRHDIGREAFLDRVWQWRHSTGDRIFAQLKKLGCSLDWDRAIFTMDAPYSAAVIEAFVRLHEEGLIYRARRLINWCPNDRTALSDLEVDYDEGTQGELYEFAYPLADGSGEVVVATTRPETMLGDTAIAVHPDDPRHKAKIGKLVRHPFLDRTFAIIADPILVDPKFGTGAVKVTPAHDPNDFEVGQRHNLPMISIFDEKGTVNAEGGPFAGLDRVRRAQGGEGAPERAGARARVEAARPRGRPLPALRGGGRADAVDAVVREDGAAGEARHRGGGAGQDQVRPRELVEDVLPLDAQHPRLVHLAAAVVGAPHSGLVLRQMQRDDRRAHGARCLHQVRRRPSSNRTRTSSTPGSRRGCGRSRRWGGPTRRAS